MGGVLNGEAKHMLALTATANSRGTGLMAADWAEAIVKKFELAEDFAPAGTA